MACYIALLDILGFKDLITENGHDETVHFFDNFRIHIQGSLAGHKRIRNKLGEIVYDVSVSTINSSTMSDTVVFWTNDNTTSSFFELVKVLHSFISQCHNSGFVHLRGGITYGDFFYDHSGINRGDGSLIFHPIMLGKALVKAYEIEQSLQIIGCIIDESAINEAESNDKPLFDSVWQRFIEENKLVQYEMPTKGGKRVAWTVNWVSNATHPKQERLIEGFSAFKKKVNDSRVQEKISNTADYYKYVKENIYKGK